MTKNPYHDKIILAEKQAWAYLQFMSAKHAAATAALDQARKGWNDAINDLEANGIKVDDDE